MAIACEAQKSIKAIWFFESQVRFTNIHGWTIINELNDVHLTKRYVRMGGLPLFSLLDEPLRIPSISSFYWRLL